MSTTISTIDEDKLKVRWEEPYVSEGLNKVVGSFPCGILFGFDPVPDGAMELVLNKNTATAHSAMRVRDAVDGLAVLYLDEDNVSLDLTPFASTVVFIGVTVSYAVSATTSGLIKAYSNAEYVAGVTDCVWICRVTVPASGTIPAANIDTLSRMRAQQEPYTSGFGELGSAWNDQDTISLPLSRVSGGTATVSLATSSDSVVGRVLSVAWLGTTPTVSSLVAVVPVSPTERIVLSWKTKLTAATATTIGLYVEWLDKDLATLSTSWNGSSASATTAAWAATGLSVVAPANAVWARVSAGAAVLSAGTVLFDRILIQYENTGTRSRRRPIVGDTVAWTYFMGDGNAQEYGKIYYDSDANALVLYGLGGLVSVSGALSVATDFTLATPAKRSKRWIGGYSLQGFCDLVDIGDWDGGAGDAGITHSAAGNKYLRIPLHDLPIGARILEFGVVGAENAADVTATIGISLVKRSYAGYVNTTATKGSGVTSAGTGNKTVTVVDTSGAASFETRTTADSTYELKVAVNNDGTPDAWMVKYVWVTWDLSLVTPALY